MFGIISHSDCTYAQTNSALDCLHTSAKSGGLDPCLNESGQSPASVAGKESNRAANSSAITKTARARPDMKAEPPEYQSHEGPNGYKGTFVEGFWNGAISGFLQTFQLFETPAVGLKMMGADGAGDVAAFVLGIFGVIAGVFVGLFSGAVGAVTEKISPGSTKNWPGWWR